MANSNLTPQKRLDKNGRLVTKHVRIQPNPDQKKLGIPKIFGIKAEMGVFGKWDERDNKNVSKMLINMDQNDLLKLRDIMMDCDDHTREQLQGMIRRAAIMSDDNEVPKPLDENIQYAALMLPVMNAIDERWGDGFNLNRIDSIKARTDSYLMMNAGEVPQDFLSRSENEKNLIRGHCMMKEFNFSVAVDGQDDEDMQWLGGHWEELRPYYERMTEMDHFDRELLEDLLGHDAPSLSKGVL